MSYDNEAIVVEYYHENPLLFQTEKCNPILATDNEYVAEVAVS